MGLVLSLARVLYVTLRIFAHHPLGVLWVTFVALLFSFVSFGILIGPMQVGFNAVMLRYLRRGEWAPELLWQQFRREAFLAGWVYLALLLVGLVVPLPLERSSRPTRCWGCCGFTPSSTSPSATAPGAGRCAKAGT
jgi:hypothetical protein